MLVLSRKRGETIVIRGDITVTVLSVNGNRIRLGLNAPPEVHIMRGELAERELKAPAESEDRSRHRRLIAALAAK